MTAVRLLTLPVEHDETGAELDAALAGDERAFARLYDRHVAPLFAFCVGLTGDRESARALVQDTFVRAWEKLHSFRGESAFGTWLHRIAVNLLLHEARTARRRALRVAVESDLFTGNGPSPLADAPQHHDDPTARMDLETAMTRVPPGARAVFVLHDIGGYSHAEIAQHLGIAEGTSKAHLFRARRLLRGMLER
ncbi:RNA polymerase sigma factor [Gemmatimonas sp.]